MEAEKTRHRSLSSIKETIKKAEEHEERASYLNIGQIIIIAIVLLIYVVIEWLTYTSTTNRQTTVAFNNNVQSIATPSLFLYLGEINADVFVYEYESCPHGNSKYKSLNFTTLDHFESYPDQWVIVQNVTSYNENNYTYNYYTYGIIAPENNTLLTQNKNKQSCSTTIAFGIAYQETKPNSICLYSFNSSAQPLDTFNSILYLETFPYYCSIQYTYLTREDLINYYQNSISIYTDRQIPLGTVFDEELTVTTSHDSISDSDETYYEVVSSFITWHNLYIFNETITYYSYIDVYATDFTTQYTTQRSLSWTDVISAIGGMYTSILSVTAFVIAILSYGVAWKGYSSKYFSCPGFGIKGIAELQPLPDDLQKRLDIFVQEQIDKGYIQPGHGWYARQNNDPSRQSVEIQIEQNQQSEQNQSTQNEQNQYKQNKQNFSTKNEESRSTSNVQNGSTQIEENTEPNEKNTLINKELKPNFQV